VEDRQLIRSRKVVEEVVAVAVAVADEELRHYVFLLA